MKRINKILNYLDSLPNRKNKKLLYFIQDIFAPINYAVEYYCFYFVWKKIVLKEILTNDNIVNFLDRNEFCLKNNIIYKKDIIEKDNILDTFNPEDSEDKITQEFTEVFSNIIEENSNIDIENYVTLFTEIDITNPQYKNKIKIYKITIMFYRYFQLQLAKKRMIYWFITVILMLIASIFVFNFWVK